MNTKFETKSADTNTEFDHIDTTVKRIEKNGARMEGRVDETREREDDARARTMEVETGTVKTGFLTGTDKQVSSLEARQERALASMLALQQSVTEQTVDMRGWRETHMHEG